jgi:type IV secretion system protein TrbL
MPDGMTAGILDTIVIAFVSAIGGGTIRLLQYSIPILGFAALMAYCTTLWPLVLSGGDALGPVTLMVVRIGVFYFLCVGLASLSLAAFDSFLLWGTLPSGGAFTSASFLNPSRIVDAGFRAVRPLEVILARMSGWPSDWFLTLTYTVAKLLILAAFACMALHVMMTILEFHLAVMTSTILVPWGILSHTAFLAEFAFSWITAGLIRVFLTVVLMSLSIPLFETLKFTLTPGGDPTTYSALIYAMTAGIFAILSWQLPKRAAQVGGRGMALAMGGELLAQGAFTGVRAAQTGLAGASHAVRGMSRMVQAARGHP